MPLKRAKQFEYKRSRGTIEALGGGDQEPEGGHRIRIRRSALTSSKSQVGRLVIMLGGMVALIALLSFFA